MGHTIQNLPLAYPWSHKPTTRSTARPATIANPASWTARQRPAAFPVAAMSRVALMYPPTSTGISISDCTRPNGSFLASGTGVYWSRHGPARQDHHRDLIERYRFLSPGGQVYLIDGLCMRENQERALDRTG